MIDKSVIKGTRLTVDLILERLGNGASMEDFLDTNPQLRHDHNQAAQAAAYLAFETI